jgi:hypothetical protein
MSRLAAQLSYKRSQQEKSTRLSRPFGLPCAACLERDMAKLALLRHVHVFFRSTLRCASGPERDMCSPSGTNPANIQNCRSLQLISAISFVSIMILEIAREDMHVSEKSSRSKVYRRSGMSRYPRGKDFPEYSGNFAAVLHNRKKKDFIVVRYKISAYKTGKWLIKQQKEVHRNNEM